jgi:hypothetical protein
MIKHADDIKMQNGYRARRQLIKHLLCNESQEISNNQSHHSNGVSNAFTDDDLRMWCYSDVIRSESTIES